MKKPYLFPLLIGIPLLTVLGCSHFGSKESTVRSPNTTKQVEVDAPKAFSTGLQKIYIEQSVQGSVQQRSVIIHAPEKMDPNRKYPVVFALHGNGGQAEVWARRLRYFVDNQSWIGIYPQGVERSWNLGKERSKADDVEFIEKIVDELKGYKNIDGENLFVIGFSNGAGMAHKLAIETNHFQAIATIVTSLTEHHQPTPKTQPVSVLQVLGMKDRLIPYEGGYSPIGHTFIGAEDSARLWAKSNGCDMPPISQRTSAGNTKIEYTGCKQKKKVVHYGDPMAGHRIPGDFEGGLIALCLKFFEKQFSR